MVNQGCMALRHSIILSPTPSRQATFSFRNSSIEVNKLPSIVDILATISSLLPLSSSTSPSDCDSFSLIRQLSQLSWDFSSKYFSISLLRFFIQDAEEEESLSNLLMVRLRSFWSIFNSLKTSLLLSKLELMALRQWSIARQALRRGYISLYLTVTLVFISALLNSFRQLQIATPQFFSYLVLRAIVVIGFRQEMSPPQLLASIQKSCSFRNFSSISSLLTNLEESKMFSISSSFTCLSLRNASSTPQKQERLDLMPSFGGNSGRINPSYLRLRSFISLQNSLYLLYTECSPKVMWYLMMGLRQFCPNLSQPVMRTDFSDCRLIICASGIFSNNSCVFQVRKPTLLVRFQSTTSYSITYNFCFTGEEIEDREMPLLWGGYGLF